MLHSVLGLARARVFVPKLLKLKIIIIIIFSYLIPINTTSMSPQNVSLRFQSIQRCGCDFTNDYDLQTQKFEINSAQQKT